MLGSECGVRVFHRAPAVVVNVCLALAERLRVAEHLLDVGDARAGNIRRNDLTARVSAVFANALEKPSAQLGEFDCIVCNPPYIPTADIPGLDESVREYEPHVALDGGADGLDFYRAVCTRWRDALHLGSRLFFEVGIGQADDVLRLMRSVGFGDVTVVPDLNGIPRVVWGTLKGRPDDSIYPEELS